METQKEEDEKYMRRALQLARYGEGHVSPNPMVGCVIVDTDDKIIGEGWHRRFGEGHAEVNAMASVREEDKGKLEGATVYVTLEPCSHYGKTPPCADMLAATPVKRVVVGMIDPNPLVKGHGVQRLKDAGKEVECGVLEKECRHLNRRFIMSQILKRPYVTLKFACDRNGMMGRRDQAGNPRTIYSNPLTTMWAHRERSRNDAIMVGRHTADVDKPSLTLRYWTGKSPVPVVIDRTKPLRVVLHELWGANVSSLLVEGGSTLLKAFVDEGLYDEVRQEINPGELPGDLPVPDTSDASIVAIEKVRENCILLKRR